MGLINLTTNLKNLRFDKDTPGGGSSGLPYIKDVLPEFSPDGGYSSQLIKSSIDYPYRGGTSLPIFQAKDATRIRRFLNDFPKGPAFTAKQIGLQKTNPLLETGERAGRLNTQVYNSNANLLAQIVTSGDGTHVPRPGSNANDLLTEERKYEYIVSHKDTNQNRLVVLWGTKIQSDSSNDLLSFDSSITKLGISPIDNNILFDYAGGPGSDLYGQGQTLILRATNTKDSYDIYKNSINAVNYNPNFTLSAPTLEDSIKKSFYLSPRSYSPISNRYNNLLRNKFQDTFTTVETTEELPTFTTNENGEIVSEGTGQFVDVSYQQRNLNPTYFSNRIENDEISPKGILQGYGGDVPGVDNIVRAEQSPYDLQGTINQFNNTMAYSKLITSKGNDLTVSTLQDFRAQTNDETVTTLANSVSYTTGGPNGDGFKIESRIGVGSPGRRPSNNRSNFYNPFPEGQDKINMSPIYRRSIDTPVEQDSPAVRDLIKFCIEAIDNGHPKETSRMHFRAYITNFSDNIGAEWDSKKYMGRGENFYTYQGFTRDVSFTFIVAAQSVQEMEKIYQKVNYLASTLHPDYQEGTGFMRGSLHKLTIGEYFYRTTGVITSMNISVEDNYPWEIKMRQPELEIVNAVSTALNNGTSVFDPSEDDRGQMEVPQILKIQMSFKPIMDTLPQRGLKEPIIVSEKIANNYLSRKDFKFSNLLGKAPIADEEPTTPSLSNTDTIEKPPVTTTTNDVNTPPPAATTTTQAPPAESWVPESTVEGYSGTITGVLSTATWKVVRDSQKGYFKGIVNIDNGFGGVVAGSLGTDIETTKTITVNFALLAVGED